MKERGRERSYYKEGARTRTELFELDVNPGEQILSTFEAARVAKATLRTDSVRHPHHSFLWLRKWHGQRRRGFKTDLDTIYWSSGFLDTTGVKNTPCIHILYFLLLVLFAAPNNLYIIFILEISVLELNLSTLSAHLHYVQFVPAPPMAHNSYILLTTIFYFLLPIRSLFMAIPTL